MVLCRAFLSLNNKLQDIVVWTIKNNFNSHLYIELLIQLLLKNRPQKFGVIKEKHPKRFYEYTCIQRPKLKST